MRNFLRSAFAAGLLSFFACATLTPAPAFGTVSAVPPTITYAGNSSTTVFPVPFNFQHASDLVVSKTASGTTTTLALGTDYTVQGVGSSYGGAVTTTVAPASGSTLTIIRLVAETQPFSFRSQSYYNPALHEQAFDWLEYQIQEITSAAQTDGGTFGGTATSLAPGALIANAPITGDGSSGNHLGFNFGLANTWTNLNTFDAGVRATGSSTNTAAGVFTGYAGGGIGVQATGVGGSGYGALLTGGNGFLGAAIRGGSDIGSGPGQGLQVTAGDYNFSGSSAAGIVASAAGPAGIGVTGLGTGSGAGLSGVADTTGTGVQGTGGTTRGAGGMFTGGPASAGVVGAGGFDGGPGGYFTGGADGGAGVVGLGKLEGPGVIGTGGTGSSGSGGDFSGVGGLFTGGAGDNASGAQAADGVVGRGGAATSGTGAAGGNGGTFTGGVDDGIDGPGAGLSAVGGATDAGAQGGVGVNATGTGNAAGVVGVGGPHGPGGQFTGGGNNAAGVVASGGPDGGPGGSFTGGVDGGAGVYAVGGGGSGHGDGIDAFGGTGVYGKGQNNGLFTYGGYFECTTGASGCDGVYAVGYGTGSGVHAFGGATGTAGTFNASNAVRGAINLLPGPVPSSPLNGDLWNENLSGTAATTRLVAKMNGTNYVIGGQPHLQVFDSAGNTVSANLAATLKFASIITNTDSAYNASTGVFTVPANKGGNYMVCASLAWTTAPSGGFTSFQFVVGTGGFTFRRNNSFLGQFDTLGGCGTYPVAAGGTISVNVLQTQASASLTTVATGTTYMTIDRLGD